MAKKENKTILKVKNVSISLPKGADRPYAVQNISFELNRNEILCIVGESGSGKSVLSSAIMGYLAKGLAISDGAIEFSGQDIAQMSEKELFKLRGDRISMIFQEPMASLNPSHTIGSQIEEVFKVHSDYPKNTWKDRTIKLLEKMLMPTSERIYKSYPHQLSGGQCQRVIIAMALALEPDVLIADEPTTALDVTSQAQILSLINNLRYQRNNGIIFITHDFGVVADIADRVAVMENGIMVEFGTADQILNHPKHPYTQKLIDSVPSRDVVKKSPVTSDENVLEVKNLYKTYGGVIKACDNISIAMPKGSFLTIVGESGSGKSTLANTIIRLQSADSGAVLIGNDDFLALNKSELLKARKKVQMVFQDPFGSLNPKHTIGYIIARGPILQGVSKKDAYKNAEKMLEIVGLTPDSIHRKPHEFSGGQRQRIGVARAIAMEPDLLIADEAVSALDVSVQKIILELFSELQEKLGLSILLITHDLCVAAQVSDYIGVMQKGVMVEYGTAKCVFKSPKHEYTKELFKAIPGQNWNPPRLDNGKGKKGVKK